MENNFKIILILHIAAGFSAFVAAPVAMAVKKGGKNHRLYGKIFFWCMTIVTLTAFVMSVLHPNIFLFAVSGFSYYMVASGYRWIFRKRVSSIKDVAPLDWVLLLLAAAFNLFLFGLGVYLLMKNVSNPFAYITIVFGIIGISFVIRDLKSFISPPREKHAWLLHHMGSMVGGYIATVSAFSAVNFNFLPAIIQWLWPTIIGVPLLAIWIGNYKKKFKSGKKAEEIAEVRI